MAYETDEYGNRYYIPDAQYTGGTDWGSGLTSALSAGATGAQLGAVLGGPAGALLLGGLGAGLGGLYGLWQGTEEQNRLQADEAARIEALRQARKRMEQGFADERSALETQRQLAEQMNPAEALYGTQGRPGLLQAQQAQLAQQMAAQGARNRAALASRGLLGSGMEAATSGALAGQQAGAQAQLQANIAQQYMQQQQARQQQLGQLGLQQAQLTQRQAAARSAQDLGALQQQQQIAQQIAQRNQALLQSGLQAVGTGLGAYQQAQALDLQRAAVNAQRAAAKLPEIDFGKPMFQSQAQQAVDFLGGIPGQIGQGLQGAGQAAMSGLGQIGQGLGDLGTTLQGPQGFSQGLPAPTTPRAMSGRMAFGQAPTIFPPAMVPDKLQDMPINPNALQAFNMVNPTGQGASNQRLLYEAPMFAKSGRMVTGPGGSAQLESLPGPFFYPNTFQPRPISETTQDDTSVNRFGPTKRKTYEKQGAATTSSSGLGSLVFG